MRRALVLSDEVARHPFRASLPAHCRVGIPLDELRDRRKGWSMQDLRDFLLAYCACFVAVTAFIL
ncbi:MAG: hypothetical protein KDE63_12900 [Novosphingobium sp.]|nr:hypothetical protein [Novosphingobium sp.]